MSSVINVFLAIAFVVLAFTATFLMYHLWGYPFSKKEHRSTAPRWAMALHRLMGWAFVAIYIYLMIQMLPRMWTYQIELPARTVFHLVLGYSIGGILIAKIAIVRFFKHLESTLAPPMGTTLFILTVVLMGLALPSVWRERVLAKEALGSEGFSEERVQRVRNQLPEIGYDEEIVRESVDDISSKSSLFEGRKLLRGKCVECHDLRTILARPRTAKNWRDTVERMANRATVVTTFSEKEKWQITAYLIAITPTLQNSIMEQRKQQSASADSMESIKKVSQMVRGDSASFDVAAARGVFETKCSLCHDPSLALNKSFESADEVPQLVSRMVGNGLVASTEELEQIVRFLQQHHNLAAPDSDGAATDDQATDGNATVGQATTNAQAEDTTPVAAAAPEMPALALQSGCAGCHAIDSKIVGPGWSDVAARYRDDPQGRQKLIDAVKNGGASNWIDQTGGIPMPANFPQTSQEDIETLVDFILALP